MLPAPSLLRLLHLVQLARESVRLNMFVTSTGLYLLACRLPLTMVLSVDHVSFGSTALHHCIGHAVSRDILVSDLTAGALLLICRINVSIPKLTRCDYALARLICLPESAPAAFRMAEYRLTVDSRWRLQDFANCWRLPVPLIVLLICLLVFLSGCIKRPRHNMF